MDFTITFEQQALIESLAAFVEKELYPYEPVVEQLRAVPDEIAADIKQKAKDAGFTAMNMPTELGCEMRRVPVATAQAHFGH